MSFQSLDEILNRLQRQPGWGPLRQYRQVCQNWPEVVSPEAAVNSRPLAVNRQVLWVATSSAAWAQNLSLQRYCLLKKLNPLLSEPLQDMRFASAQWHRARPSEALSEADLSGHPSFAQPVSPLGEQVSPAGANLQAAFEHWAQKIHVRAQSLPLCPRCQAPTPGGELERWSVCAYCAAQI